MSEHRHLNLVSDAGEPEMGAPDGVMFEAWYKAHHARLRSMCDRMLRDNALAEDVAQETLLRAWARRRQFERDADLGPWLRTVARNLCIEAIRSRGRAVPASDAFPEIADDNADPSLPLERAEEHAAVRAAMLSLSDRHRAMLYARDVQGIDYDQLAAREGLSENATRAVLFRARRVLREKVSAATRAVGAAILWIRLRSRDLADKGAGALAQPAIAVAAHGALAATIALAIAVGSASLPSKDAIRATPTGIATPSVLAQATAAATASVVAAAEAARGHRAAAGPIGVAASVDRRNGDVTTKTTVKNPVTGEDEYVWTRVWREHGTGDEDPSVVLGTADTAAETACDAATEQCETFDDILEGDPTP